MKQPISILPAIALRGTTILPDMIVHFDVSRERSMKAMEAAMLQDEKIWREFLGKEVIPRNNACELYFEENDLEAFVEKLERLYPEVQYVNRLTAHSWGQKMVRFYDLDGNLIEVRTPE